MLTTPAILIVLGAVAAYALLSKKLEASVLTLPMVFTALGLGLSQLGFGLVSMEVGYEVVHVVAEVTLIIVLFADASQVRRESLKGHAAIPARMLLIGMPLVLLIGTVVARGVSPDEPWALAVLVAAILTPTDAALGQSLVASEDVPKRIRQSISVESGLNDGLALPVVLVAAILAAQASGTTGAGGPDNAALFTLAQVTLGPIVGVAVGFLGARLLDWAVDRDAATRVEQGLYFLALAFVAYFAAEVVGGNGFIAAFVGGLVFGNTLRAPSMFIREFMEGEGQLLTMLTFLVFGAVLAPLGLAHASWPTLTLAVLFLTAVRMGPIWLALAGTGLSRYEKLVLGWFGPRGLASVLFALLVLERFALPGTDELVACVVLTVLLSIVLHGVSATFLARRFRSHASGDEPPRSGTAPHSAPLHTETHP